MEPSRAEEIMEYVLQGVGETPIVHLDKSASTLVPLVEQEKKRYLIRILWASRKFNNNLSILDISKSIKTFFLSF